MSDTQTLQRLQTWFDAQCDGDWEHGAGVRIESLDNPGWRLLITLGGTELASRRFEPLRAERSEDDWLHAWLEDDGWNAACGSRNLEEAVITFLTWAGA